MARRHAVPLLLMLIAPLAGAAESGLSPNPVSPEAAQEEGILDTTRGQVRGFSLWLGESVNDWFGDKPFADGGKVSHGRLGIRASWREDDGSSTTIRLKIKTRLDGSIGNAHDKITRFVKAVPPKVKLPITSVVTVTVCWLPES